MLCVFLFFVKYSFPEEEWQARYRAICLVPNNATTKCCSRELLYKQLSHLLHGYILFQLYFMPFVQSQCPPVKSQNSPPPNKQLQVQLSENNDILCCVFLCLFVFFLKALLLCSKILAIKQRNIL